MDYKQTLEKLTETARFMFDLDVVEVAFVSGHTMEFYVANTPAQRARGLADIASLDADGMLFYYDQPTYRPYTMKDMQFDLDIAWYDNQGHLIDFRNVEAGQTQPIVTWRSFSYVIEAPVGTLPQSNILIF